MSDKKKLLCEIDIMHGKVLDIQRKDVTQYNIRETNNTNSGKQESVHILDEILNKKDFY